MIIAKIEILSNEVMNKCKSKGIEAYTLKKSKANCIAFCSNDRKRREFEVTFLKDAKFRISTRFTGYKKVMINEGDRFIIDNDPDGRRKRFNVNLDSDYAVDKLLIKMLDFGFSEEPETQHACIFPIIINRQMTAIIPDMHTHLTVRWRYFLRILSFSIEGFEEYYSEQEKGCR